MRRSLRVLLSFVSLLWIALVCISSPVDAAAKRRGRRPSVAAISYSVDLSKTPFDRLEVTVAVERPRGKTTRLALPAWTPGSYLIRDFARDLSDMRARKADGTSLPVTRIDKQTWEIRHNGDDFTAEYYIHARTLSVRTSYADDVVAVLNGASIFTYIPGATRIPVDLAVVVQEGATVATSLESTPTGYRARDYDQLVDAPLSVGTPSVRTFEVEGTSFDYVFHAPEGTNADLDRLVRDARAIVTASAEIMGGFPFERYVFHVICDRKGGGGLEHDDSTVMILRPWAFDSSSAYERAASLLAHEFFHAWNVKRIHDQPLGPFDYTSENYTDLLWFHEGFTETMEARILLRAGLVSSDGFLNNLERNLNRYLAHPGRDASPLAEISRIAWVGAYKPAPHHRNTSISYYLKGGLFGVSLDLELRAKSIANGRPLASVERLFQSIWALRDDEQRVAITDRLLIEHASTLAGEDLRPFFDRHVYGTEPLPLIKQLAEFGVRAVPGAQPSPSFGMRLSKQLRVLSVDRDGPAQRSGLLVGDELIAINAIRIDSTERLGTIVASAPALTRYTLLINRAGRVQQIEITSATPEAIPITLERTEAAPEPATALRDPWLRDGSTATPRP